MEDSVRLIDVISLGWVGEVTGKAKAPQLEGIPFRSLDPEMCPSSKFRGWWCHKQWPQSARMSLPSSMNHEKPFDISGDDVERGAHGLGRWRGMVQITGLS